MVSFRNNEVAENQERVSIKHGPMAGETSSYTTNAKTLVPAQIRNLLRRRQRVESSVNCAKEAAVEVHYDVVSGGANAVPVTFLHPSLQ